MQNVRFGAEAKHPLFDTTTTLDSINLSLHLFSEAALLLLNHNKTLAMLLDLML